MNETNFLTKDEIRGKRNPKNQTVKRHERHSYDDAKDVKGGQRGHSRHHDVIEYEEMYEDDPYSEFIDWKKIK
jgi:hypothetical protein